ncbi:MAG: hypothetical protein QOC66_2796 [Pseudonocardiales bacterium]|nr:hypothetical protein [Pseudonocardiales bacterium]
MDRSTVARPVDMRGRKRIGEVVTARFEAVLHARLTLMTYQHEATPVMYVDLEDGRRTLEVVQPTGGISIAGPGLVRTGIP